MRACVFTAKIHVLGTQFMPPLGAAHLDTPCGTASRVWVPGALARLQVLLGGMVICHIRFSTTLYTMVVVFIAIQFYTDKLACSPPLTEVRVLPGSKVTPLLKTKARY